MTGLMGIPRIFIIAATYPARRMPKSSGTSLGALTGKKGEKDFWFFNESWKIGLPEESRFALAQLQKKDPDAFEALKFLASKSIDYALDSKWNVHCVVAGGALTKEELAKLILKPSPTAIYRALYRANSLHGQLLDQHLDESERQHREGYPGYADLLFKNLGWTDDWNRILSHLKSEGFNFADGMTLQELLERIPRMRADEIPHFQAGLLDAIADRKERGGTPDPVKFEKALMVLYKMPERLFSTDEQASEEAQSLIATKPQATPKAVTLSHDRSNQPTLTGIS